MSKLKVCAAFVEDLAVCDDTGEAKGQCVNCGEKWFRHSYSALPEYERESVFQFLQSQLAAVTAERDALAAERDGLRKMRTKWIIAGTGDDSGTDDEVANQLLTIRRERDALAKGVSEIKTILLKPASNRRLMQIAQPARECLNIIKAMKGAE